VDSYFLPGLPKPRMSLGLNGFKVFLGFMRKLDFVVAVCLWSAFIIEYFHYLIMRRFISSVLEVLEVALIAIVSVFLIRTFLVQPFLVSGASMEPNFSNGDYLLIDEITYKFRQPERGEVLVFRYPNNESTFFIKRAIGLPGERVVIEEGKVQVFNSENPEGLSLKEYYLQQGVETSGKVDVMLKEGEYFVLGDNRSASFDSRSWGVLKTKEIIGLARVRLWPISDLTAFAAPSY